MGSSSIWLISALTSAMQSTGQSIPHVLDSFNRGPLEDSCCICSLSFLSFFLVTQLVAKHTTLRELWKNNWGQCWGSGCFFLHAYYLFSSQTMKLSVHIHLALVGERNKMLYVFITFLRTLSSIMMCLQQFDRARNLHIRLILLHVISMRLRIAEEGERERCGWENALKPETEAEKGREWGTIG